MFREGVVLSLRAWSRVDTQEALSERLLSKCLGRPGSALAWSKGQGGALRGPDRSPGRSAPAPPTKQRQNPSLGGPVAGGLGVRALGRRARPLP